MSEANDNKEGGLQQPSEQTPDAALTKTGGGESRDDADQQGDGGMAGEGETGGRGESEG
jgi:hypothetical protein